MHRIGALAVSLSWASGARLPYDQLPRRAGLLTFGLYPGGGARCLDGGSCGFDAVFLGR